MELGSGFSFVARQKRMSIGKDDFYLDLLFFHRHLRRLVAIELKLEPFAAAHAGQMELYLRWLDRNERAEGEESPLLCERGSYAHGCIGPGTLRPCGHGGGPWTPPCPVKSPVYFER